MAGNVGQDFLDLYGLGQGPAVDYSIPIPYKRTDVYPREQDSLEVIIRKARRWDDIIQRGASLAAAFGYLDGNLGKIDYEKKAEETMLTQERKMWLIWKEHRRMPPLADALGPQERVGPAPQGEKNLAKEKETVAERIRGLRYLYANTTLDERHYWYFVKNYQIFIPLLVAAVKIEKAKKAAASGTKADPLRFQEMLAARYAQGVANLVKQREAEELKKKTRELTALLGSVHTRKLAVTDVGDEKNKKQDPLGDALAALGGKKISAPTHYTAPVGAGRLARQGAFGMEALGVVEGKGKRKAVEEPEGVSGPSRPRPQVRPPSPSYMPQSPGEEEMEMSEDGQVEWQT